MGLSFVATVENRHCLALLRAHAPLQRRLSVVRLAPPDRAAVERWLGDAAAGLGIRLPGDTVDILVKLAARGPGMDPLAAMDMLMLALGGAEGDERDTIYPDDVLAVRAANDWPEASERTRRGKS